MRRVDRQKSPSERQEALAWLHDTRERWGHVSFTGSTPRMGAAMIFSDRVPRLLNTRDSREKCWACNGIVPSSSIRVRVWITTDLAADSSPPRAVPLAQTGTYF